jgi:hypothetical protein
MASPHDGIQSTPAAHGGHDGHGHGAVVLPFSDADITGFRQEDVLAGKMIVGLMTGIFLVGCVLYVLVAMTTWPGA